MRWTLVTIVGAAIVLAACTGGARPSPTQVAQASSGAATVPNVVGVTTRVADQRIQAAGLLLEVELTGTLPEASQPDGLIQSQVPSAGTVITVGTIVTVRAVCVPKPCGSPTGGRHIYDPCTCATR